MAKKNLFYGAVISYGTVTNYYHPPTSSSFGGFVFQLMIDDKGHPNNDFKLIAYAVTLDGGLLNGGRPIDMKLHFTIPDEPCNRKEIKFANMKLDVYGLGLLYPSGVTSDLTVKPTGCYGDTGYVVLTAETIDTELLKIARVINPSPPA
jgi:hypothetical protein